MIKRSHLPHNWKNNDDSLGNYKFWFTRFLSRHLLIDCDYFRIIQTKIILSSSNESVLRWSSQQFFSTFTRQENNEWELLSTIESSSKRGSFEWITNCQEFWSIEMWHLTYEMGIKLRRCLEEESSFRHQTFDFWAFSFRESYWKSFGKSCKYLSFCLRAEWEWNNQLLKVVGGGWWVCWDFNVSFAPFPFELRLWELN